jgi:hypothetical protein
MLAFAHFWKPFVGQAVDGKLDLMVLIGEREERAALAHGNSVAKTCSCFS